MAKRQSTYRQTAQTPEEVVAYIDAGIEKAGSFSKFVDSLVLENIRLGGTGGDYAEDIIPAVSAPASTAELESSVKEAREEIQAMRDEIIIALEKLSTVHDAPAATPSVQVIEQPVDYSDVLREIKASIPADIASSADVAASEKNVKAAIEQAAADATTASIEKLDGIIEQLSQMNVESGVFPIEEEPAAEELPEPAAPQRIEEPDGAQDEEDEITDDMFGDGLADFTRGLNSILNLDVDIDDDEDVELDSIVDFATSDDPIENPEQVEAEQQAVVEMTEEDFVASAMGDSVAANDEIVDDVDEDSDDDDDDFLDAMTPELMAGFSAIFG